MLAWYRIYTRLHLRLFPYEWTLAQNLATDGRPLTRALGLAFPELGVHPNDEYMFGDDLLVAPVVVKGAVSRDVLFPPGDWIDWWTGQAHAGGHTETVAAPLGTLPLFLRRGGIVPLLRPTIDTLGPTTQPARVDSYAASPGVLYPRIGAGADGAFAVFDGARIETHATPHEVTVHVTSGTEFGSGMLVELVGIARPGSAQIDGAPAAPVDSPDALAAAASGVAFSATGAFAKVPAGDHTIAFALP
jgi:alpha-D-xyloside xylohydrolase